MRVKMRYHTEIVMDNPTGGIADYHTFRANGPFDPDFTGTGNQPRYFDQWSALYNKVTICSSNCKVMFANEDANNASTFMNSVFGVIHSTDQTPPGSIGKVDMMEAPYSKYAIASGNNAKTVSLTWKPDIYYIGATIFDEDIASVVTTVPIRQCWFHVWTASQVTGVTVSGKTYNVVIEYDAIFFDKVIPDQS